MVLTATLPSLPHGPVQTHVVNFGGNGTPRMQFIFDRPGNHLAGGLGNPYGAPELVSAVRDQCP